MKLTKQEEEEIYKLAETLTGSTQRGNFRKEILVNNVCKRIYETKKENLNIYLEWTKNDPYEYKKLISALTIHTTSWFREMPHWNKFKDFIHRKIEKEKKMNIAIWTPACSTGEEVYTICFLCEEIKLKNPEFIYKIYASDIDPISILQAQKSIFSNEGIQYIPVQYHRYLQMGSGPASGLFSIEKRLRDNCHFFQHNLFNTSSAVPEINFDVIICRNVLIYFEYEKALSIVKSLTSKLVKKNNLLILGHSEALIKTPDYLNALGSATYELKTKDISNPILPTLIDVKSKKKSVLIIDDSQTIRMLLKKLFLKQNYIIKEAINANEATNLLKKNKFDLITLDLNMPGENGVHWLKKFRKNDQNTPIVIISESSLQEAENIFGALENGAQEYIVKSQLNQDSKKMLDLFDNLTLEKEKISSNKKLDDLSENVPIKSFKPEVIILGASTGGPEAISKLLPQLPKPCPPVIIIQHIFSEFSFALAKRVAAQSGLSLGQIGVGSPLIDNHLYMATGDKHLIVLKKQNKFYLIENSDAKVNGHRPSIDVLMKSAANLSMRTLAIILTGMGKDGAEGMLALNKTGCSFTMGQDENSSVVYGMPKVAKEIGALQFVGNLKELRLKIDEILNLRIAG